MTILRADAIPISLPYEIGGPKPMLAGRPRTMDILLIRVETDKGLIGWGDAFCYGIGPATRAAFEHLIAPWVIGRDESGIAGLHETLSRQLHLLGRGGAAMFALAGLDIALWDIAGKAAGQPLCALLGGAKHKTLPVYASLMRYANADLVARNTTAALERGYRAIKLHEITANEVRAARGAMGNSAGNSAGNSGALMMDVNCPWTVEQALSIADQVRPYDLLWFEEPVWPPEDFAGLAEVRKRCGIPLAAGENNMSALHFAQMMQAGAVDYAQPSVTKIGGVTEFMKVVKLAAQHKVTLMPHSPYFGPGLLASIHMTATLAQETMIEYSFADLGANPLGDAIMPQNGRIAVPQGPGLGRDPDMEVVERYRVK